jgi:hypothetical protein
MTIRVPTRRRSHAQTITAHGRNTIMSATSRDTTGMRRGRCRAATLASSEALVVVPKACARAHKAGAAAARRSGQIRDEFETWMFERDSVSIAAPRQGTRWDACGDRESAKQDGRANTNYEDRENADDTASAWSNSHTHIDGQERRACLRGAGSQKPVRQKDVSQAHCRVPAPRASQRLVLSATHPHTRSRKRRKSCTPHAHVFGAQSAHLAKASRGGCLWSRRHRP